MKPKTPFALLPLFIALLAGACLPAFLPTRSAEITNLAGIGDPGYAGDGASAALAHINNPFGLTLGPDGDLYFCDMGNHCIRKIDAEGRVHTVAGTGESGYSGDGGPALKARLFEPYEIRFDPQGRLVFVEMRNHLIRQVDPKTGIISTLAGTGERGFSGDHSPAAEATFNRPHSIQFAPDGRLFVCDIGNHRIRVIHPRTGIIETFAGTGERKPTPDGSPIEGTPLNGPRAIDFDRQGDMWLALREGNQIFKIDMKSRTFHHVAGTGEQGFDGNGGPAKQAALSGPKGIAVGPNGNVYFADTESHTIRMIDLATRQMKWIAGTGRRGDGPLDAPQECALARPHGIYVDEEGVIYIGDSEAHRVRKIMQTPN